MTDEELWRMTHATHSGENDALYVGKSLLDTAPTPSMMGDDLDRYINNLSESERKEIQTALDDTIIGTSRRLNAAARDLLKAMLREWRTFAVVAAIGLSLAIILLEHIGFH